METSFSLVNGRDEHVIKLTAVEMSILNAAMMKYAREAYQISGGNESHANKAEEMSDKILNAYCDN